MSYTPPTFDCWAPPDAAAAPVHVVAPDGYSAWLETQAPAWRAWLAATGFKGKAPSAAVLPGPAGAPVAAVLVTSEKPEPWDAAALHGQLPEGAWRLVDPDRRLEPGEAAFGWALAAWRYERYRKNGDKRRPQLAVENTGSVRRSRHLAEAVWLARDLIETPANDMGPEELAAAVEVVAGRFGAEVRTIVGDELLGADYPLIHAVGRASARAPRLIDVAWGEAGAPKVTLVGKGVCFDTGGLDIKPSSNMLLMKKDMAGAATMLGLAQAIMAAELPVRLRLLIPAVENSIAGAAFRPGDVLRTRKGLTVEIGNTDAEGRLILADALAEADAERPDLLIDAATLTGAARVALGPELPALFTPDDRLAEDVLAAGRDTFEPLWRLPLHASYRTMLKSSIADINNAGAKPFAGSITAALFLKEFVTETKAWAHLDMFGWNDEARPGRPRGGEATALRPLFTLIERRFGRESGA